MSQTPFMPLWVADFVGDTLDLDAKEIGAYMLILMTMWGRDGYLPNDNKKLQRVARCGRDWPRVWAAIEHYFTVDGDQITQLRLLKEHKNVASKRAVNAQSGALGGAAKALKYNKAKLANATVSPKQPEPEPYITVSKDTGQEAVGDLSKIVFDKGVSILTGGGVSQKQARSLLGKWRRDYSDAEVISALGVAQREGAIDPVAFITKTLGETRKRQPKQEPREGDKRIKDGVEQEYAGYWAGGWQNVS